MKHTDPFEHKLCLLCGVAFYYRDHIHTYKKRKYCSRACYRQELKHSPEKATAVFWSRVNKAAPKGCWEYTGARDKWGYGDVQFQRKHVQAHRLSWRLLRGEPGELYVLHKCHNPPCCNPDHLYLGTDKENSADRIAAGHNGHRYMPVEQLRYPRLSRRAK
jgi:hypothetical protein